MASFVGAIMRHDPAPLPETVPEVLRFIVMKALQREPAKRYATAKEMRRDLREAEHKLWQGEQRPPDREPVVPPPARIPQPTVPSLPPAETMKLDPALIPEQIEPVEPPVLEERGKSRATLWVAGVAGALLLVGIPFAVGIYLLVSSYASSQTPQADGTKQAQQSQRQYALKQTLTGHSDSVLSVAFSPDAKMLASGSVDKTVKLWQVE